MATQFDAISAKLKAMNSVSLTDKDYEQLLQKKSVGEICGYLKNYTGYKNMLSGVNEMQIHRTDLELIIEKKIKDEYTRLYKFIGLYDRKTLRFMFIRDEIDFMKHRLRYILNNELCENMNVEEWVTPFFKTHTTLDVDGIVKANDFNTFIEACKGTIYYDVFKRVSNLNFGLFDIAMMLDSFYYCELWKSVKKFVSKSGLAPMKEYLGTNIDLLNILWIYRSKKYYNTPNEIIYTYLIPVKYKLQESVVTKMVEAENIDAVVNALGSSGYRALFENLREDSFVEENYKKILYKTARKVYRSSPASMAAIYAYFYMRDIEVGNITTIIEGIRYNFDSDAIGKLLVR